MKKIIMFIALMACFIQAKAQNVVLQITDHPDDQWLCIDNQQSVIIYAQENCGTFIWYVRGVPIYGENPIIIEPQLGDIAVEYEGCGSFHHFMGIHYLASMVPTNEFIQTTWKHQGHLETLEPVGTDSLEWYNYQWNTGETTSTIDIIEPGIYTCEISDFCGSATRTFIVKDNVEIALATCDLESNLNMVTWPITAAQAEYIDHVRVERDGIEVGTANYSDGVFIDNIGSDAAARTYTLIAVTSDGTDCPIQSYPKETIHMSYTVGVNNTIEVGWNTPTGYNLLGYNICEWHPGKKDGDLTVIDYVGAGVNNYTCSESQFDYGMVVVQGVEAGKTESRLLSNRSLDYVGLNELTKQNVKIYPNPSNGTFTVEGTTQLTIYNTLGQIITQRKSENGTHSFSLAPGIYFVKSDEGIVKKVVVE